MKMEVEGTTEQGGSYESFDSLGDDTFQDSEQGDSFDFEEESAEDDATPIFKREAKKKEEAKKKADKGQKGDDLKALEVAEGLEEEESSEEEEESEEKEVKKEEKAPKAEEKPKDEKASKGKKLYMKIGDETFAVDSGALIPHKVDGKPVQVPLQELLNNYSGQVAWDKRMNEVNVKNQEFEGKERSLKETNNKVVSFVKEITDILKNPESDPDDILEKIAEYYENNIDENGVDLYDLKERSFKLKLAELAKVLNLETDAERKAYFLEKRNENLSKQTEKRRGRDEASKRVTSYRQKTDELRKSYGVSEIQYVDALEELRSFGSDDKDISEKMIVEWAATKPHRSDVQDMLESFRDQISEESYGEIVWSLSHLLRQGKATKESIQKDIQEIYGLPTEVKELSQKLSPIGRKKEATHSSSKKGYESFEDIEDF